MAKIKIMCTSTGCIEYAPERYRNLGIEIIRIHILFNGKEYKANEINDAIKANGQEVVFKNWDNRI